ncbi:biliverdin-producing heme oxygenase [Leeuwenhoekiella parthenopeia]|uniref:Biliverdin-producing heme oxygenase n=1 Tax=Leeuwenhoekiella parthenopeia TaxID=2890320 RepID=A0ABS8GTC7_9FLAO|nr:biliverdin-producing heme oxygenase [Leeuwenhoekiella parthenopeia]MCC4213259.1 biliverdin-producing heme oxygenase [Leeuwenhoekiella parthenopeia]
MILDHLKTQTTVLHKETEQDNLARFILDHSITPAQYLDLLKQNWYAYTGIDGFLDQNKAQLPAHLKPFADGSKSLALKRDLLQLGYSAETPPTFESRQLSAPALLGMIYVAEGSMLGGLLIRKNLESCSKLDADLDHHFFGKKVQEVMQRWQDFKAAVSDREYTPEELEAAVAGAHLGFGIFKESYTLI